MSEPEARTSLHLPADFIRTSLMIPHVVRLENRRGEEIVGPPEHLPAPGRPARPRGHRPPAFGKTKETLFGLALTLCENFRLAGKPVAVIRYDGIRKKGESHNDPEAAAPYEMLNTNFTQGAEDIVTVLDWLQSNPKVKASSVVLLTFSFSALEARIVLRDEVRRRQVEYWVACMGTPEFRDLMVRINCGLDFLEHYQLGIKLGVMPVLGNLVNVDAYVADGVVNSVATLEQAREDMRHLDLPITWIYGAVRQLGQGRVHPRRHERPGRRAARGDRRAHRSQCPDFPGRPAAVRDDHLAHLPLPPQGAHPAGPAGTGRTWRSSAARRKTGCLPASLRNRTGYWQRYLVGDEKLLGFDVMALSDDYQQLMSDQLQALELQPGRPPARPRRRDGQLRRAPPRVRRRSFRRRSPSPTSSLKPCKRASAKLLSRFPISRNRDASISSPLDIEMSRYLAVRRFLDGEVGTFEEMADKVENLTLESAIKIQEDYSPKLHRILRGERITAGPRRLAEDPLRPSRIPDHHRLQPRRPVCPRASPKEQTGPAPADHARPPRGNVLPARQAGLV
ncbi:MAG: hypothetical protein MZU79_02465 [Anaerotruncus sp.]|nr:hypothetical protein [Anaerotruncus sp.]